MSEAEARLIAVAQRDAGGSHQRAIDRSEQTGDEGGVGCEADRSSLGHGSSLSWRAARWPPRDLAKIYVYQMPETMHLFA